MKRRKILWLSHFLPWPPKSGLMLRSHYLMRETAKYHDVQLIAFRQRAHQPDYNALEAAKRALSEFATIVHVSDLPEDRIRGGRKALALRSLLPGAPYTVRWGMSETYRHAVEQAITTFKPDVVHFDTISLAPYLAAIGDTPATLTHHNIESHMLLRRAAQESNPLRKLYFWQEGQRLALYERKMASRFRLHLVCADLDSQRLVAHAGNVPVEVVPNGVDLDYFRPADPAPSPLPDSMIFVGGLSWYPNASAMKFFVYKVWPILANRRPSATVKIIGRSPPSELVDAARNDSRIELMGFVDDIRPLVDTAMVYVCPIFDGGGTKLKMIDAMAMGKAIVAHPVSAEGLELTHGKNVLLAEEAERMTAECIRLFDDTVLRNRLGKAARQKAEDVFGFDRIGAALARRYADLA